MRRARAGERKRGRGRGKEREEKGKLDSFNVKKIIKCGEKSFITIPLREIFAISGYKGNVEGGRERRLPLKI